MPNDLLRDPGNLMEQARRNPLRTIRRLRAAGYQIAISAYPDSECTASLLPYAVVIERPATGTLLGADSARTLTQALCAALAQAVQGPNHE